MRERRCDPARKRVAALVILRVTSPTLRSKMKKSGAKQSASTSVQRSIRMFCGRPLVAYVNDRRLSNGLRSPAPPIPAPPIPGTPPNVFDAVIVCQNEEFHNPASLNCLLRSDISRVRIGPVGSDRVCSGGRGNDVGSLPGF